MSWCACGSHRTDCRSHSLLPPEVPKAGTHVFRFAQQVLFLLLTQFPHGDGDQTQGLEHGKCLPCRGAAYTPAPLLFYFLYLFIYFIFSWPFPSPVFMIQEAGTYIRPPHRS